MNWFKNLRFAKKLSISFLTMAVIAAIVGVIGIINLLSIGGDNKKLYENDTLGLQYTGSAAVAFQQIRYDAIRMKSLDINDKTNMKTQADDIAVQNAKIADLMKKSHAVIKTGDNGAVLGQIQTDWDQYQTLMSGVVDSFLNSDGTYAVANLTPMAKLATQIRDNYLKLFDQISVEAAAMSQSNTNMSRISTILLIVTVVLAVIISLIIGAYISKIIGTPLRKMVEVGKQLSLGNVEVDNILSKKDYLLKEQKDEIGELALAFHGLIATTKKQVNAIQKLSDGDLTIEFSLASEKDQLGKCLITLTENLNTLIGSIRSSSDQVSSGASMVSHSSISLSQGSTEQASSVQQLTASLDEIASQTNLNAQNATKANELAFEARQNAESGNDQMKEMLTAMEEISTASANIKKIIKVIDDIAFQTNILALNAAVEAARAGQHGKGFAVVAEEVRTLAARSANAANETTDLIENSIKKVETGTKIANETAGALRQIVDQVDKAANLVSSIAKASTEQAIGVEQISQGITQVSQVVQTNAATAEESAAASEELSAQSEQLKETVSIFKITKAANASFGYANQERQSRQLSGKIPESGFKKARLILDDNDMGKY